MGVDAEGEATRKPRLGRSLALPEPGLQRCPALERHPKHRARLTRAAKDLRVKRPAGQSGIRSVE